MEESRRAKLEAGLQAWSITAKRCEAMVDAEHYFRVPDTTVTVCALVLRNGFTVVGMSGCATQKEYRVESGKQIARQNALHEVQKYECYALRNEILREF